MTFRAASVLGGGVGRMGSVCGAVTGSVMGLSLKRGRKQGEPKAAGDEMYKIGQEFWKRFEEEVGSALCYDITKTHLWDPEARRQWVAGGGSEKCRDIMRKAARIAVELADRI